MADYWEARKAREMYEYMEDAEKVAAELERLYDNASMVIREDIDKIFKRFASRFKLSEEEARRILETTGTDINAVLRHMNNSAKSEGVKETLAEINAPAYRYRINNLEEKQQQIDLIISNLRQQEQAKTTNLYKKLAEKVYNHSMFDIQQMYGLGFSFTALDEKVIDKLLKSKWSGANYSKRIWKNTDKLAQTLKEEMLVSMLTGRTDTRTAEAIQERMQVGAYESRRLVRTESCHISKEMEMAAYDECGIETYIFLATLDMRTSEICQKLDKKQFKVSEQRTGVNAPPMHPFCRSAIISAASAENIENMKRRAFNPETGKTEVVPGDMKYEDWKKSFVDGDKSGLQEIKSDDIIKVEEKSEAYKHIQQQCEGNGVEFRKVKKLSQSLSSEEIIERLAGGDMTEGSCSSLAFAYIGNRNGLDVLDFRGGNSQYVFSLNGNIEKMLELPGVGGSITMVKKEISGTMQVLNTLELNKEYYLSVGKHAAIVRRLESGVEYLELQSKIQNGWMPFDRYGSMAATLNKRFGCRKTVDKQFGKVWEKPVVLLDVDSFKDNEEFEEILGYINTAIDSQKKGVLGDVK